MSLGTLIKVFNSETLNFTATITSDPFRLDEGSDLGIWYKGTATGADQCPSYTTILEVSPDTNTSNFVAPTNYPSISTVNSSSADFRNITAQYMQYGRIKFIGRAANPSDTSITAYIFNREDAY